MKKHHTITCRDYAQKFDLGKGQLNPHHSEEMRGRGNPRFGVLPSSGTKRRISIRHRKSGRFKGLRNPMFGKTHSLTARKKISERLKIALIGENNPFYGKKHTKETRLKISRIRIEKGLAKGKNNPLFGKGHSKETKAYISRIKKDFFIQHPEKHLNQLIAKNYKTQKNKKGGYISRKQIEIYEILKEEFQDAQLNYPLKTKVGLYFADVGIPSLKLNIEYDSSYWHKNKLKDFKRDTNIKSTGWNVIRIKEEQIKQLKLHTELRRYIEQIINAFQRGK
ncbi:MAG: NUMOD3 domain-containing DNA-binding protein [Nanoarchaeota archaeon]|nr:NUMOD3 domain-containing DNA-binding protein [Nanoarchaeota archaeon]